MLYDQILNEKCYKILELWLKNNYLLIKKLDQNQPLKTSYLVWKQDKYHNFWLKSTLKNEILFRIDSNFKNYFCSLAL